MESALFAGCIGGLIGLVVVFVYLGIKGLVNKARR